MKKSKTLDKTALSHLKMTYLVPLFFILLFEWKREQPRGFCEHFHIVIIFFFFFKFVAVSYKTCKQTDVRAVNFRHKYMHLFLFTKPAHSSNPIQTLLLFLKDVATGIVMKTKQNKS